MKPKFSNKELDQLIGKFQEGGEMNAPEQAPAAADLGGSPEEQILQAAMLAVQTQDGQLALQVCQALVEMAGGQPAAPQGQEPVYRKGGKLIRYQKK